MNYNLWPKVLFRLTPKVTSPHYKGGLKCPSVKFGVNIEVQGGPN